RGGDGRRFVRCTSARANAEGLRGSRWQEGAVSEQIVARVGSTVGPAKIRCDLAPACGGQLLCEKGSEKRRSIEAILGTVIVKIRFTLVRRLANLSASNVCGPLSSRVARRLLSRDWSTKRRLGYSPRG